MDVRFPVAGVITLILRCAGEDTRIVPRRDISSVRQDEA